jgi:D-alanyl-D-alanine carboxypeptidase/D-alanyl-D-alanine-endopeptidase (penicillin-binding protein 4)
MGRRAAHARLRTLVAVVVMAVAVPATAHATALQSRITSILSRYGFADGQTGVRVFDLSTSSSLYARNIATLRVPASNEKLVTSATALARWGARYRFKTELYTSGTLDADGVLHGRLYLKGYGDPSLSTPWYQKNVLHLTTSSLADFVTALKNAGVKKIKGRLVGDETWFDAKRMVSSWKPEFAADCGPLSALSLNEGTTAGGARASHPPLWTVRKLTDLLEKANIPVSGTAVIGTTPPGATLSYTEYSARLSRILAAMNKPSDNFFAEMLAKGLGKSFGGGGTTAAGVAVEKKYLVSIGIRATAFRLADGSGLSYSNRLAPAAVSKLLRVMSKRTDFTTYWRSLAIAGVDGTLKDRMRNTAAQKNLHGKTGTLAIASNLSGYVTSANDHRLIFSILMNKSYLNVTAAHVAQDAIGVALARSAPAGPVAETPQPPKPGPRT